MQYKRFVLGKDPYPKWFNEQAAKGRAKLITDIETGKVTGAALYTATKTFQAKVGDTIRLSIAGLSVVTAEELEK